MPRGISSLKQLFENVSPGFPFSGNAREIPVTFILIFPGQGSEQIISPYDLINLDSGKELGACFVKTIRPLDNSSVS